MAVLQGLGDLVLQALRGQLPNLDAVKAAEKDEAKKRAERATLREADRAARKEAAKPVVR